MCTHVFCVHRDEIAACIDKAYLKIAMSEAARMLFFDSQKPMQEYAQKVKAAAAALPAFSRGCSLPSPCTIP